MSVQARLGADQRMAGITDQDIAAARARAQATGQPWCVDLQEHLGLDNSDFLAHLGATLRMATVDMHDLDQAQADFNVLAFSDAQRAGCLPLRAGDGSLQMVIADPLKPGLREWVVARISEPLHWRLAHAADLAAYFARFEAGVRALDSVATVTSGVDRDQRTEDLSLARISEDASPIIRLVNSTLYDALRGGASDVHMESTPAGLTIKYRIDGVLAHVGAVAGTETAEQVISRIKVLAELDIAERRVPQDGRFKVFAQGRDIDLRVSIMPSIHGEDAVLRVLDKQHLAQKLDGLSLESLGFEPTIAGEMRRLARLPYGMLLVTGPTGSGKTTTLYAALTEINTGQDKIITIEDPVEYQLPGILQIPVNEKKGLSFARGLRSILRHDPDKIMVGEIRDGDTANIAVQAALTGHLVFTSVHANNVFDVLGRFTHMEVDPYSLVAALNGILAQRLVRNLCPHCAVDSAPDQALLEAAGIAAAEGFLFRTGSGCGHCRGTGYRGRRAVAELMVLHDELREPIVNRQPPRVLKDAASRRGTRLLRDAGLELVRRGETSLQELMRVVV